MRTLSIAALLAFGLAGCSSANQARTEGSGTVPMPPAEPIGAMATCEDGMAGDYACGSVDLVAHVPVEGFGSRRGNDIWGWTDPETGIEYALVGLDDGTAFVSLADPMAPAVLGKLPTATESSTWRDIKTYANHAFIVSEAPNHGMQIFDLRHLRGLEADSSRTFEPDAHYRGVSNAHNLVMDEESGFAYIVGTTSVGEGLPDACGSPGFHAVDVHDPSTPSSRRASRTPTATWRPAPAPATRTTRSASSTAGPTPTTTAASSASAPMRTC